MAGEGKKYRDKATGEIKDGNNPFYQFYKHNFKLIRWVIHQNSLAAEVLFFLVENMDKRNALVISQRSLAEALEVTRMTVHRCIKFLQDNKVIKVYKSGNTNVYAVNADIVWQKSHAEKVFARFDAKVYLSKSEQDDQTQVEIEKEFMNHVNTKPKESILDKLNGMPDEQDSL